MRFSTYNVQYEVLTDENYILVKGQITNDTTRNYTLALFKLYLYGRESTIAKGVVRVYDFRPGSIKLFETVVELHRSRIPKIISYDMVYEQGY